MTTLPLFQTARGTAEQQASLWNEQAAEWAHYHEPEYWPLYEHALRAANVGARTRLLDVGCGSGYALGLAVQRGAAAAGIDAAVRLVEIARLRVPQADVRLGAMEALPFDDEAFDVVTGFNAFSHASSSLQALREARRVTRLGGLLAMVCWGSPLDCEATAYWKALASLVPPLAGSAAGPFAFSEPGKLAALATEAGWEPLTTADVPCHWHFRSPEAAFRALLAPSPAVEACRHAGEEATRRAIADVLARFVRLDGVHLRNKFRCLIARR